MSPEDLTAIAALHEQVDRSVEPLAALHRERLKCRLGCIDCCVDGISVFELEAERIRVEAAELLATGTPHPAGRCAFLDSTNGACRIYAVRPYVCRTQGLPLRWLEETAGGEIIELRDICPLNEEGTPIESLPEDACWTIGAFEDELAASQLRAGGALRRVSLRSLFER